MVVVHVDNPEVGEKADGFEPPEGSNPGSVKASDQVTTGILDQVMHSWG